MTKLKSILDQRNMTFNDLWSSVTKQGKEKELKYESLKNWYYKYHSPSRKNLKSLALFLGVSPIDLLEID